MAEEKESKAKSKLSQPKKVKINTLELVCLL